MADNFGAGEAEAYQTAGPSITSETMGPAFKIVTTIPNSRGAHVQLRSDYLMPAPPKQTENVTPAIALTDWGTAMTPGMAIPPAVPAGAVGAALQQPAEDGGFQSGVIDGYPEGVPVPLR